MSSRKSRLAMQLLIIVSLVPDVYADSLFIAVGRNPFQPVSTEPCDDAREQLTHWQLKGIVSGADDYSGWVQRPGGHWQKLIIGTRLLPNWQVTHISSRQVILQYANPASSCFGSAESVVLSMR
ncbi:pilus assembly protein PilP [Yersinia pekkanenii]|uniref:Type IV pilus biogenesis protein PilP n=1 Tax=Yersinia pekkanenii TaxID=1288385 RepID=A0A0T9PHF3_9GAMM|nr:pilus assembly protein PilP [Yersinia pekkanenii]CNH65688.1 type IV pilus biogenesis protein PilP [Yersinia pekkanenii]CRY67090.1 type IV pilus biogenesis protein PilP [Yersinia pekkanenii]